MSEEYEYLVTADAGEPGAVLARARLARGQAELLSALVAGGPVPPGFDPAQVRVQARGLAAKRRETVARVAPELPRLLGAGFVPAFGRYAAQAPMTGGHRADALAFAAWVLRGDEGLTRHRRAGLVRWYGERAGAVPRGGIRARVRLAARPRFAGRLGGRPGGGR